MTRGDACSPTTCARRATCRRSRRRRWTATRCEATTSRPRPRPTRSRCASPARSGWDARRRCSVEPGKRSGRPDRRRRPGRCGRGRSRRAVRRGRRTRARCSARCRRTSTFVRRVRTSAPVTCSSLQGVACARRTSARSPPRAWATVRVHPRAVVGIVSTGDELVATRTGELSDGRDLRLEHVHVDRCGQRGRRDPARQQARSATTRRRS